MYNNLINTLLNSIRYYVVVNKISIRILLAFFNKRRKWDLDIIQLTYIVV